MKKLFLLASILLFASCGTTSITPNARYLASHHRTIAIIPPVVYIKPLNPTPPEILENEQRQSSVNYQNAIFSQVLNKKMKSGMFQDIQPVQTTNAILMRAGYFEKTLTQSEICQILGVDAVITSFFNEETILKEKESDDKKSSYLEPTEYISCNISLQDCANNTVIYNYSGSERSAFINIFISKFAKNLPYGKK